MGTACAICRYCFLRVYADESWWRSREIKQISADDGSLCTLDATSDQHLLRYISLVMNLNYF
jgi:hypothetical protein